MMMKRFKKVWELSGKTAERLNKLQKSAKTVTVKFKTYQFETLSKQMSLEIRLVLKKIFIILHIYFITI